MSVSALRPVPEVRETGLFGGLVAWVEPGLVLCYFSIRDKEATAKLGRVPRRLRRAAANR